ncbi:MAG: aspartate-semialdehyde dehydrogenase [Acidobacteria bacterium]|nr:MAG: aspartate-semialdehyde dehydrogenase [Acidobacteriota bacterium]
MEKKKLNVSILGATGSVGQKLIRLLHDHPWFEIQALAASDRSAGKTYADAVHWLEPTLLPRTVSGMKVLSVDAVQPCDLLFSALDNATATRVEHALAEAGNVVVSNASALRMDPAVPLVVPEVNPEHLEMVRGKDGGCVVTNPNCATVGLVLALKPLVDRFGIEAVDVTTLQAVSGAGYPGVPAMDILSNVIPHIDGEADKLEEEPGKIFGCLRDSAIEPLPITVSAQVTRVPVIEGHLLSISVKLSRPVTAEQALEAFKAFRSPLEGLGLPSAPERPVVVLGGEEDPQPRLHSGLGGGMTVSIAQVRVCPVLDLRFVALVHNTVRGAAGAAVLNAELMVAKGLVPGPPD